MRKPKEIWDEIVELAKSKVFFTDEPTEDVTKEIALEDNKEMPSDDSPQPEYLTRGEFEAALKEMKEMYAKVLEVISPSQEDEVPANLSSDDEAFKKEVAEEQLSSDEKVVEDVVHDPESVVASRPKILYQQGRRKTTQDYVFESIFKNKNQ